jgi:hypothetical protein
MTVVQSDKDLVRQARAAETKIKSGAAMLVEGLYQFARIKGWKALGFASFEAWAETEISWARSTAYLKLREAKVLGVMSDALGLTAVPDGAELPDASVRVIRPEQAASVAAELRPAIKHLPPVEQIRAVEAKVIERSKAIPAKSEPAQVRSALAARFRQLTDALDALLVSADPEALEAARQLHAKLGVMLGQAA